MKSNTIGNNSRRRIRILNEILQIDFKTIFLIANKKKFYKGGPLSSYKQVFIKYLHDILYQRLYNAYPKLKIVLDEIGYTEFQAGFKNYVKGKRPRFNFFDEYDFDFIDSKKNAMIQIADLLAGTLNRQLQFPNEADYRKILNDKLLDIIDFPETFEEYTLNKKNIKNGEFNNDIFEISYRSAKIFLEKYNNIEELQTRLQKEFIYYLLFQCKINPTRFITSNEILSILSEFRINRVRRDYFYRQIVAPLRDEGVIISSTTQGYKIPISESDILAYINQTNTIVAPMLHRLRICRDKIKIKTNGKLDILESKVFARLKSYLK